MRANTCSRLHWFRAVLLSLTVAGLAPAADWPQWLGPGRDSVWRESGLIERFPSDGPKVVWRQDVALGYAGPAVAGGRVFVADYVTTDTFTPSPSVRNPLQGTERIQCFSATDGTLLWKHEHAQPYRVSYPYGPRVTPTVDGPRVYALGAEGRLCCLQVEDGTEVWSRELTRDFKCETPMWGFSGHPLVDGQKLICLVGGEGSVAVAFDKLTGRELWRALSAREPGYCPPTILGSGSARQLLIWHSEALVSLDPETGRELWNQPIQASYGMSIATPRWDGPHLFIGAIVNKALLLELDSGGAGPKVLWRAAKGVGIGPVFSTPFLEDGHLYGVDRKGELRCVRLSDGAQLWTTMAATTGDRPEDCANAFLVKQGDRFVLFNQRGELILARLSPAGYDEISRCKILEPTSQHSGRTVAWSHPAFARQCVFARNDKQLVCVSLASE